MPQVPLRAYNQEIDALVDKGQTELAIAHCLHVINIFPKHLDTYRLLGKAYLEAQRYDEAADILLRVLTSVPDDFISQIGMSIIREEQGNVDAAIHHMERAFEIQPANAAVQDELRRLYGRRDGTEPGKVRLTRGALVRMYVRGELYDQAVAEIHAAQKESNELVDLDILLARVHYLTGRKGEAATISRQVVERLPYCFEANRILAEVLEEARNGEASLFQERVYALEPHLAAKSTGGEDVPSVMIERLDEKQITQRQVPAWVDTFGSDWKSPQPALEPDQELTPPAELNESMVEIAASPAGSNDLPDWMQAAGWVVAGEEEEIQPSQEADAQEFGGDREIAAADVPEWVSGMQPGENEVVPVPHTPEFTDVKISAEDAETDRSDEQVEDISLPAAEEEPVVATAPDPALSPQETIGILEEDVDFLAADEEGIPDWLRELAEAPLSFDAAGGPGITPTDREDSPSVKPEPAAQSGGNEPAAQLPEGAWAFHHEDTAGLPVDDASSEEVQGSPDDIPEWLRSALAEEEAQPTASTPDEPLDIQEPQVGSWKAEWQSEEWHPAEEEPGEKPEPPVDEEIASDLAWLHEDDIPEAGVPAGQELYEQASQALGVGNFRQASHLYEKLLEDEHYRPAVIEDLRQAVVAQPDEAMLWQMLGEALVQDNQLDEALKAYNRAEELLK